MYKFPIRVSVVGAAGRMGKNLIKEILKNEKIILTSAFEKKSDFIGSDIGDLFGFKKLNIKIDNIKNISNEFDILVDFSAPKWDKSYLSFCLKNKKAMIIGTTCIKKEEKELIKKASKKIPIILSVNFSFSFNLILKLSEITSKIIGNMSEIEILDFHHKYKNDCPSGTALIIGDTIAKSIGTNLKNCAIYSRSGFIEKRKKKNIGFSVVRAGNTPGEHTIIFAMKNERIEITHRIFKRTIYSHGVIKSILWLIGKKNGLFNMKDILNSKKI